MVSLMQLWAPILLSAVLVFFASSLIHMVLKYHNSDYRRLPNEDEVRGVVGGARLAPGQYMLPHCEHGPEMKSEAAQAKFREGPVGMLILRANGLPAMGAMLGQWFAFTLAAALMAGYIASRTLAPGEDYMSVFRLVSAVSFLTYSGGSVIDAIWMGRPWPVVAKDLFDGLVYGLLCGGAFGWLWP